MIDYQIIYTTMLSTLITKYGLMLSSKDCAEALAISTRTLDERRKKSVDCPEYLEARKSIMYPVQNVVEYQLTKTKQCVQILN